MSDFPSSRFERGARLARTGAKVGANYAKRHLQKKLGKQSDAEAESKFHRDNARQIYNEFAKLRGTALKLAQTISIDGSMVPEEFADVMAEAQYSVPPISKAYVRRIIQHELGKPPEQIFDNFEHEAFAAASLGQVHRARLKDGTNVAVKVQYPNVRETIESDLQMAKSIYKRMVNTRKIEAYFDEIRSTLLRETDYIQEGEQIKRYHEWYTGDEVVTPEWIPELSTSKVLTMTLLDGVHLSEFIKEHEVDTEMRDHFGQLLFNFFHAQVNEHCTLHADAHPGNFLYTNDGRLGVLDFGCVKTCPPEFFYDFLSMLPAHIDGDEEEIRRLYYKLEILVEDPDQSEAEMEVYQFCREFSDHIIEPYRHAEFDFGNTEYRDRLNKLVQRASELAEPRGSQHFVFLSRLLVGVYRMMMKLGAQVKTEDGIKRIKTYVEEHANDFAETEQH